MRHNKRGNDMTAKPIFLSDAQLKAEAGRCLYCEEKPCKAACPADCSPADFRMAVKTGERSDFRKAAKLIMGHNTFGGVCGAVCPDWFCVKACWRRLRQSHQYPRRPGYCGPAGQELGVLGGFRTPSPTGKSRRHRRGPQAWRRGDLPAGLQGGIYEKDKEAGGACRLIPDKRFNRKSSDRDRIHNDAGRLTLKTGQPVKDPSDLLKNIPP